MIKVKMNFVSLWVCMCMNFMTTLNNPVKVVAALPAVTCTVASEIETDYGEKRKRFKCCIYIGTQSGDHGSEAPSCLVINCSVVFVII